MNWGFCMFNNIEDKIDKMAGVIFWCSIILGILWFILSCSNYFEYKDLRSEEYIIQAIQSKSNMINSIILILSGSISAYLINGFGKLIYYVKSIYDHMTYMEYGNGQQVGTKKKRVIRNEDE